MPLYYTFALFVLCYFLVLAEFLVPSGGVIGAAAVIAAAASIVIAFTHSLAAGGSMIGLYALTTPLVFFLLVRLWPKTAIGRRILNRQPGELAPRSGPPATQRGTPLRDLVGKVAVANTDLLPSGQVAVAGEKVAAVSAGMPIDAGTQVIVTAVAGKRLRVRPAEAEELSGEGVGTPPSLEAFDVDSFG